MARKPKPKPDDKEQSQRFVETARSLEVDESGKSFEKAIESLSEKEEKTSSKPSQTSR